MRVTSLHSFINFRSREVSDTTVPQFRLLPQKCLDMKPQDTFVRQPHSLNVVQLKILDLPNFRLIDSNSVRGGCLAAKSADTFKELKSAGIETIIDLRKEGGYDSKYAQKCNQSGLNYFNFKLKENMAAFNPPLTTKLHTDEFSDMMNSFVKQLGYFFNLMNEGRVYMGCLLGLHRTDLAVSMNYLLNPNEPQSPPVLSHMFIKDETNFTNKRVGSVKNLIKNLTPEHIKELGLAEDFKEIFDERVLKLRLMNLVK